MDIDKIRKALSLGMPPLTLDQQRWLWMQAYPDLPLQPPRKICDSCYGEAAGCLTCGGTGFKLEIR